MATNARKHVIPAPPDETVNPETIFETFGNSIRDTIPVANSTEQAQVVAGLAEAQQAPTLDRPVTTHRADAPGMHRTETSVDGITWLPASGVLHFPSDAARDSWTTTNRGLLTVGDRCVVGAARYEWSGSAWASAIPGPLVLARTMQASNTFQDRTAFTDFPVAADAAALTGRLVKAFGSTRLIVRAVASVQMTSGVPQNGFLGVSIGGSSYEVALQNFGAVNARIPMHGIRQLTGIPAGDYEVKPQFRSAGGSIFLFFQGQDFVNIEIQEAT